jgi:hypothetical protein
MTDAQIIAIAVTVLAVLAGSVFNNVRIGDVNTSLSARMGELNTSVNRRMDELNTSVNRRLDDLKDVLRAEFRAEMIKVDAKLDTIITMLGNLDTRVTKLEARSHEG